MSKMFFAICVALGCLLTASAVPQPTPVAVSQSFTPLSNPKSRSHTDWEDLYNFKPQMPPTGTVWGPVVIQEIANEDQSQWDRINLDYYELEFDAPHRIAMEDFFQELRLKLPDFVSEGDKDVRLSQYIVLPSKAIGMGMSYGEINKINKERWESSNAANLHAVMSFDIEIESISRGRIGFCSTNGWSLCFFPETADVMITKRSPTDFIFSTVTTIQHGWHPVSGHRGFGLKHGQGNKWIFYTMGADRVSKYPPNKIEFIANATFQGGHQCWVNMLSNMSMYLSEKGLNPGKVFSNSERYEYPFPTDRPAKVIGEGRK
jgi:hypothetical protein